MEISSMERNRTLLIGIVAGALIGLAGALIVLQRAEQLDTTPQINPGDGVKIGLGVLGLLRLVSDLGDKE